MSLICENCKAVYKGKISPHSKFVRCPYCDSVIVVPRTRAKGQEVIANKEFSIEQFRVFLTNRGISDFDPVSGVLKFGNEEVIIDQDGTISGPKPLKSRVEKWLHKFTSQK